MYPSFRQSFLLTRPSRGATRTPQALRIPLTAFLLTRPSRGATRTALLRLQRERNFYSHAPRGARLRCGMDRCRSSRFLLTRPSRGATDAKDNIDYYNQISTHTPLAGRDSNGRRRAAESYDFYSHAPRGARRELIAQYGFLSDFYSHAPRGARPTSTRSRRDSTDFYSHAPRGARRVVLRRRKYRVNFYSHAPRGARRL